MFGLPDPAPALAPRLPPLGAGFSTGGSYSSPWISSSGPSSASSWICGFGASCFAGRPLFCLRLGVSVGVKSSSMSCTSCDGFIMPSAGAPADSLLTSAKERTGFTAGETTNRSCSEGGLDFSARRAAVSRCTSLLRWLRSRALAALSCTSDVFSPSRALTRSSASLSSCSLDLRLLADQTNQSGDGGGLPCPEYPLKLIMFFSPKILHCSAISRVLACKILSCCERALARKQP
ncbi:hypothetical protein DFJ74DRAFT_690066 [Hyaloraphidium curvatum]|nr:hypothetical protein DFJ74DRAFT_690066 [Hyaloraphidium curvatum]